MNNHQPSSILYFFRVQTVVAAIVAIIALLAINNVVHAETAAAELCGPISADQLWTSDNVYLLTCDVTVSDGFAVTIQAGTVIKANPGSDLYVDGALVFMGTAGNEVVFTSYRDDAYGDDTNGDGPSIGYRGDWGGINIRSDQTSNFHDVIVRYARTGLTIQANNTDESLAPAVQDSVFEESYYDGLYAYASGTNSSVSPAISNTQVISNSRYGLYVNASASGATTNPSLNSVEVAGNDTGVYIRADINRIAQVSLHNSQVHHNSSFPIYLHSNGWISDAVGSTIQDNGVNAVAVAGTLHESRTWAPFDGLPYWMDDTVTVYDEATLTLPAGLLVKSDYWGGLTVDGALELQSTAANEVIFTSYRDDFYGGDTNGDGLSFGSRGDWNGITLRSDRTTDFHDTIVRFADTALTIQANSTGETLSPVVRDSVFEESYYDGLYIYASGGSSSVSPTISNTQVISNSRYGLRVYASGSGATTNPSLSNVNVAGNDTGLYARADSGRTTQITLQNTGVHHNSSFPVYLHSNAWISAATSTTLHNNGIGAVAVAGTLNESRTWSLFNDLPFWLDNNVTVSDGITLTLPAGLLVKSDYWGGLTVDGALALHGSAGNEVVFTSYRDDSYGGDTNGDGLSFGSWGDWYGITLRSDQTTEFHDAVVRFADTALTIQANNSLENLAPAVQDSVFEESYYDGLYVYASGTNSSVSPVISNTKVISNSRYGLHVYASGSGATTNPSLSNVNVSGNNTGLYLRADSGRKAQVVLQNTTIQHNSGFPVYLNGNSWLNDSGSTTATNNGIGAVAVAGTLYEDRIWTPLFGLPYWMDSTITVYAGATLTLPEESLIKASSWSGLVVDGALVLQGTAGNEVVFTSFRDDAYGGDTDGDGPSIGYPGDWNGITLRSDQTTDFHDVIVRYADTALTIQANNTSESLTPVIQNNLFVQSYYDGLYLNASGSNSNASPAITNTQVISNSRYGLYTYASGSGATTSPALNNVEIAGNDTGLYSRADNGRTAQVTLRNSEVHHNGNFPIYLYGNSWLTDTAGTTVHDNTISAVAVAGTLYEDRTWTSLFGLPYWIDADITVSDGVTLTLPAGLLVKADRWNGLVVDGTLSLGGSGLLAAYWPEKQQTYAVLSEVVFTSYRDDEYGGDTNGDGYSEGLPGDWDGITIRSNQTTDFHDAIVRYANSALTVQANSTGESVSPTIQNALLVNSSNYGIYAYASGYNSTVSATVLASSLLNNQQYGLYAYASGTGSSTLVDLNNVEVAYGYAGLYVRADSGRAADVTLENSDVHHVSQFPVYLYGNGNISDAGGTTMHDNGTGAIAVAGYIEESRMWTQFLGLTYWLDSDLTVLEGATLTLAPGVIVKADPGSDLFVDGSLVSLGTAENKVIFTSYRDDVHGGDTNGDGLTTGSPGDWNGIELRSSQTLAHTLIRYASTGLEIRAYYQDNASNIHNNEIEYSGSYGIYAYAHNGANSSQFISNTIRLNPTGFIADGGESFSLEIKQNNIFSNTNYGLWNKTSSVLDATLNWWGHNSGPFHATNVQGQGNAVSDNVTYSPWLTEGNVLYATISASQLIGRSPLTVSFTPTLMGGTPPITYSWDFNDDGIVDSDKERPQRTFVGAGTYQVRLTVQDSDSKSFEATRSISVEPPLPVIDVPLEIVLIQDETGSMSDDIANLKALAPEIWDNVALLSRAGFRMGVVGFRDFARSGWGNSNDWVYRRLQNLTENRTSFLSGVTALTASGGADGPEAQYAAIYYAITPGHPCIDSNGDGDCIDSNDTPVGQQPSFLPFTKRVILLATDANFHDPLDTFGYPDPEAATVLESLRNSNTTVIGLVPGGAGRIADVDLVAAETGGSVEDTGSSGQDVAIAIAEAIGGFGSSAGADGTLGLSIDPFYNDTDPITARVEIGNPDGEEHTYSATIQLLDNMGVVDAVTSENIVLGAAGITTVDAGFAAQPTGQYSVRAKLGLDGTVIRQQFATVTVLDPDAQHLAEDEAAALTRTAMDEFDDMSDRVADALSTTLIEAGWDILSEVLADKVGDLFEDTVPDHATFMYSYISERYEEILILAPDIDIYIREYALTIYELQLDVDFSTLVDLSEDGIEPLVEMLVEQGRTKAEALDIVENLRNVAKRRYREAIRGLFERTMTGDDIDAVTAREDAFNKHISTQPFTWSSSLDNEFARGRACISQVTESYPIESYRFDLLGKEYGDDITMTWFEDQQNTVVETTSLISKILNIVKIVVIVVAIIVFILALVFSIGVGSAAVAAIATKVYHFLEFLATAVLVVKYVAMLLILVGMVIAIDKIAPVVKQDHDATLDAVETLIDGVASPYLLVESDVSWNGKNVAVDTTIQGEAAPSDNDGQPVLSSMIFSTDGRVVGCSWDSVPAAIGQDMTAVSQDFEVTGDDYRLVSALQGGSPAPFAVRETHFSTETVIDLALTLTLDKAIYQPGDPVEIEVEITNGTDLSADNLLLAIESSSGQTAAISIFDLTAHETKRFSDVIAANELGSYVMRATIIGNGMAEVARHDQPYVVGSGLSTAVNMDLSLDVLPDLDVNALFAVYGVGDKPGTAELTLRTLDRLNSFAEVYSATESFDISPVQLINREVTILPVASAQPGLYRTWLYLDGEAYAYHDFTVIANDTLFSALYLSAVRHEIGANVALTVEVTNATYDHVDADLTVTVTAPDSTTYSQPLSRIGDGLYTGSVLAPVAGTYSIAVDVQKEGRRTYGDLAVFFAGQRSELALSVKGRPVLGAPRVITISVTSKHGLPVPRASILLRNESDFLLAETNESGEAAIFITARSSDSYQVSIRKAGYALLNADLPVYIAPDIYPPGIVLFDIPSLTNKSDIIIHGATEPDATLTMNDESLTIDASGQFTVTPMLVEGANTLVFQTTDLQHNTRTLSRTITLDQTPPALTVDSLEVTGSVVYLSGATEAGSTLTVDGLAIPIDIVGHFVYWHPVPPESKDITLVAMDAAGNETMLVLELSTRRDVYLPLLTR